MTLNPSSAIRTTMRKRRRHLGVGFQSQAAFRLSQHVTVSTQWRRSRRIAFYRSLGGEVSLELLLKTALKQGKQCFLPVVEPESVRMRFVQSLPGGSMKKNHWGIKEPCSGQSVDAATLDLVLVPLVAFDRRLHRIGMGGGYYDRAFEFTRDCAEGRHPFLLGTAYSFQQVQSIVPEPWDVPLNAVVTEKGFIR